MTSIPNQNLAAIGIARANPVLLPGSVEERNAPLVDRIGALRQLEKQKATLPLLATANDLRELIRYLKKQPEGVTIVEALGEVKKRILDPRKISAYEAWGVVNRAGDWLSLSPLGWEFARKLALEAALFRSILDRIESYRSVLEHAHSQQLKLITHEDIARFWRTHFSEALDLHQPKTVEGNVISFLHLCQAAELGSLTVGKRGQPARLRVDGEELEVYIRARWEPAGLEQAPSEAGPRPATRTVRLVQSAPLSAAAAPLRIFLSLHPAHKNAAQLQSLLALVGIESELLERGAGASLTMSESAFATMRRCDAGLFVVTVADCVPGENGNLVLKPEVQAEISAAYLFYNRRVLLLWEQDIPFPSDWQNLQHCLFAGDDLTWEEGLQLTKSLLQLRQ
jgi:hypothetical protein